MPRVARVIEEATYRQRLRWAARLPRARDYLQDQLRQTCARPGTPSNRSRPGEAPRRQTSLGMNSIRVRIDLVRLGLIIESNDYMKMLNEGTSRVAARPWVAITLKRVLPQVRRILAGVAG